MKLTRRELLGAAAAATIMPALQAARPQGYLIENTTHLFAGDARFPYHPTGTYKSQRTLTLEMYTAFAKEAKLDHAVIVHSEVYQDDHRYLEYAFDNEFSPGFFKGTCLFDPIDPQTPARFEELVRRRPNRIVGMRLHVMQRAGVPPSTKPPMRNRDLHSEGMKNVWRKTADLGLLVQMHFTPRHTPGVRALAMEFRDAPLLIDHMAEHRMGTPEEYEEVIRLAELPNAWMKVSNVRSEDKPLVRRVYDAFGPDRLVWGSYGSSMTAFDRSIALIDELFDFASEAERRKIRGGNAMKLFKFPS